ncbi:uncharacterized protein LOC108907317 [Anoplophora glabripennis]|uniref:uncharacterized protein LOC108907317 n=1 Tax=Anoplophora glabripennis TaxID=217634 RepID=UPI0008747D08|nr:uncharacterized protein LOC108907317 [Anoplophora glabripennis]
MQNSEVEVEFISGSLPHEHTTEMMNTKSQYGVPENYNPADHPPVKMRNHNNSDQSETQRKRRSKNRLSNRRSTGFVSSDTVEEASKLGPDGESNGHKV